MERLKIFVRSSGTGGERDIVRHLAAFLHEEFDLAVWEETDAESGSAMQVLCEQARHADAGLFVFSRDDASEANVAAGGLSLDHLMWEAGICTGVLGSDRVIVIKEKGMKLPPDLADLEAREFESGKGADPRDTGMHRFLIPLRSRLRNMGPRSTVAWPVIVDGNLGFRSTLSHAYADMREALAVLGDYASSGTPQLTKPVAFDSIRACITTYSEALAKVQQRFWATTFLSSGFWANNDQQVIDANRRLLQRLRGREGAVRRLFLLQRPALEEVNRWRDDSIRLGKYGDQSGRRQLERRFSHLYDNIQSFGEAGCEIKIVYDEHGQHERLPAGLSYDSGDAELAIYDDWRIDVFHGARSNSITGVECFTPLFREFAACRRAAVEYFEALWQQAQPIDVFLDRIKEEMDAASSRIDYQPSWLARYDFGLPADDERLKIVELSRVKEELKLDDKWGRIRSCLDVGTCTGRYPINLREGVVANGKIIGIDNDIDSVRFARWNIERECAADARITIDQMDFCAEDFRLPGQFDLITCMLGTVSHFGRNRRTSPPYEDALQLAMERFKALLAEDGALFFTVWSEEACANRRMLSIYSPQEVERVIQWTPARAELQARLETAGLTFNRRFHLEDRLDLYHCRHAKRRSGSRVGGEWADSERVSG